MIEYCVIHRYSLVRLCIIGLTVRFNHILSRCLATVIDEIQLNWDKKLDKYFGKPQNNLGSCSLGAWKLTLP